MQKFADCSSITLKDPSKGYWRHDNGGPTVATDRLLYSSRAQLNLINRAKAGAKIARESVDKEMKALSKRVKLSESKQVVDGRLVTVLSVD